MAAVTEDQAAALLGLVLRMYARQIAVLKLARALSGISELEIDEAIEQATQRLHQIPLVEDALARKDLSQLPALVKSLESLPVDQW
jgi:hypothetical protein